MGPHRALQQASPAGRARPDADVTVMRVPRDRLGGLIHEYSQVALGDTIFGSHRR
jgi:putative transposase